MKKFLTVILTIAAMLSLAFCFSACEADVGGDDSSISDGESGEHEEERVEEHEHNFIEVAGNYLKSPATCTSEAVYYSFCSICGIKGDKTFSYGGTLPHDFSVDIVREDNFASPATCTRGAEYYCVCGVCGYVSDVYTFFAGEPSDDHPFDEKWYYDDASHYHKSTCEHNAVGGREPHDFDGDGKCKVCGAGKSSVGLRYERDDGGVDAYYRVAGIGTCTDTDIVIMPEYDGVIVSAIAAEAFENSNVESVTIPESITYIYYNAFYGCDLLSAVYYKGDLDEWLQVFGLSEVMRYGAEDKKVYLNGELLTEADINGNVDDYAFYNCKTLRSVTFGSNVKYIGDYAFYGCEGLTDVVIPDSVRSFGQNVFENCSKLNAVTLGGGVTEITHGLFLNCKSLTEIVIPSGVTAIKFDAFRDCSALKSVTLPLSVTEMDGGVFAKCYALEEIYYGGGANDWAQIDGIISLTFESSYIDDPSGTVKIDLPVKKYYFGGELVTEAVIDKATKINEYAFYGFETLESVALGNGITEIPERVFRNCYVLNTVTVPSSVTKIGESAFERCSVGNIIYGGDVNDWVQIDGLENLMGKSSLKKLYIGGKLLTEAVIDKATAVSDHAFRGSSSLTGVTIGSNVTSIGVAAFEDCVNLNEIKIPNSVTSIGGSAFDGCASLANVTIGSGVISVAESLFYNCAALESITVSDDNRNYRSRDGILYDIVNRKIVYVPPKVSGDITIPSYITEIGYAAFKGRKNLTGVAIEGEEITIGSDAFYDCAALTKLSLPENVKSIGSYAFTGCYALSRIDYGGDVNGWAQIDGLANLMGKSSLKKLYIGGELLTSANLTGVTKISPYAFYGCEFIMQVILCDTVEEIGFNAFDGCLRLAEVINYGKLNIEKGSDENGCVARYALSVDSGGGSLENRNDFWFVTADGVAYLLGYTGSENDLTLPENYNGQNYAIRDRAFLNFASITNIVIPDSVTGIGKGAFNGCELLASVTFGNNITSIGEWAFKGCVNLTSIAIPDSVAGIGEGAFCGCTSLASVTLGNNITSIGDSAFRVCANLTSIAIPDSVTSIGSYAFERCTSLASVMLGKNLTSIGDSAFERCVNLTSIAIPDCVTSIGSYAFYECELLASVTFGKNLTSIGSYAFNGCVNITNIDIPDSVTSIGKGAFNGCELLASVTFGENLTSIGSYAFEGCVNITNIDIPDSVTSIGEGAFKGCELLASVMLGKNLTSIGSYAFEGCVNITNIDIPDGVASIGEGAFKDCVNLTSIVIPDGVTSIADYVFDGCVNLTSVNIPDGVTYIGSYAFNDCANINFADLDISCVTCIGRYAFNGCKLLTSVTLSKNLTQIGDYAFNGCVNANFADLDISCVMNIGGYAFNGCKLLTSVTLGNDLSIIGSNAFGGCVLLTELNYNGTAEQWEKINFGSINEKLEWKENSAVTAVICSDGTVIEF